MLPLTSDKIHGFLQIFNSEEDVTELGHHDSEVNGIKSLVDPKWIENQILFGEGCKTICI